MLFPENDTTIFHQITSVYYDKPIVLFAIFSLDENIVRYQIEYGLSVYAYNLYADAIEKIKEIVNAL